MYTVKTKTFRLISQIGILLFLYFVCRLIFVFSNHSLFELSSLSNVFLLFLGGMRFDLSAIFFINVLFVALSLLPAPFVANKYYQKFLRFWFVLTNGFFLLLNLCDVAYFPFVHKRMQFDVMLFLNGKKGADFLHLLPTFLLQYWYLILFFVAMVYFLYLSYNRTIRIASIVPNTVKNYLVAIFVFAFSVAFCVLPIRGGLQFKPLDLIHASEMTAVQNIPALINTPFSIFKTVKKKGLKDVEYYMDEQTVKMDGIHHPLTNDAFTKQNVVVIIVESLSKKYLGCFGGKAKTPFLDSLFGNGLVFKNAFANAKESVQGIPAIISSTPSWQDDAFIFSSYSTDMITSLPNLLKTQGYQSSFFHGGSNGTMGFDSYSKLAGFDKYFGRSEYDNEQDFDGDWGIWDEPFLQFMNKQLDTMRQPFLSTVFTLNTHHPFNVPAQYKAQLKQGGHPLLSCIQYTDIALSKFFASASKSTWFKNTLFIITADHTGPNVDDDAVEGLDDYRIPIVFYKPDGSMKGTSNAIANQIDILPSTMHLLHYPLPYFAFGNNLFDATASKFSVNYNAGIFQYIDSSYCYQFNGQQGIGSYNWKMDGLFHTNLYTANLKGDAQKRDEQLKRTIQLFNHSMITNSMQTK